MNSYTGWCLYARPPDDQLVRDKHGNSTWLCMGCMKDCQVLIRAINVERCREGLICQRCAKKVDVWRIRSNLIPRGMYESGIRDSSHRKDGRLEYVWLPAGFWICNWCFKEIQEVGVESCRYHRLKEVMSQ